MTTLDELTTKLREIFQIDRPDLDFGIYKILNSRAKEIGEYLENRLPAKIKAAFADAAQNQTAQWQNELEEAKKAAAALGANSDDLPKVKELQAKIAAAQKGGAAGEAAVYNHLLTFFSRYYEEGDFISQRRYKGDTYAVPYSGEEVLLHWANKDQYYTKSGENFSNYRFKLSDGREVFFRLTAADTAKDNRKDNDAARVFVLAQERVIEKEDDNGDIYEEAVYPVREISDASGGKTLEIRFEYIVAPKGEKKPQEKANENTIAALKKLIGEDWQAVWQPAPTEKNPNRTLLEKHLADYTAKNTADYFIHKDLGGFLRRELDFYIKNEVMNLDNIQDAHVFAHIEQALRQIQTLRAIAHELIDFLAQLEDFQKKLWLKKKFVAKSHWLITLNHIPDTMLDTVFANDKQLTAWQNLFSVKDLSPRNLVSFKESNPYLTVDTSLFPASFQTALLAELSNYLNLDDATNGVLIYADNFQALNLLQARYRGQVKCIYIDPPYNSPKSQILYKNSFKHSSFLSLIENRLCLSKKLNTVDGSHVIAIDKYEENFVSRIVSDIFNDKDNTLVTVEHNRKGVQGDHFSYTNEYAIFSIPYTLKKLNGLPKEIADYEWSNFRNWGGESLRTDAANCFYAVITNREKIIEFGDVWYDESKHPQSSNIILDNGLIEVYPIDNDGIERKWRYERGTVERIIDRLRIKKNNRTGILSVEIAKIEEQFKTVWHSPKYNAGDNGTAILSDMSLEFGFPKSIFTVMDCIFAVSNKTDIILDYFAGSGTTAHAVINLNREDGGKRKYILVEQGEYFDTVLKPRVQKVVYAKDWKNGKPMPSENAKDVLLGKANPFGGVSQIVKILKLESYEDTLNNLVLKNNSDLFNGLPDSVKEDYLLRYLLDDQSKASLLNTDVFKKPFDYQMDIATSSAGATETVHIDLVETFNYLLGLRVAGIKNHIAEGYLLVEGVSPNNRYGDIDTLVIWRDCERIGYDKLAQILEKERSTPKDSEYDTVYINGDHNIATVWESENGISDSLKVRQIESEFLVLMFGEDA